MPILPNLIAQVQCKVRIIIVQRMKVKIVLYLFKNIINKMNWLIIMIINKMSLNKNYKIFLEKINLVKF